MQARIIDGKYEIVRELSKGGMGAVYEARHLLTRRKVALKLILAETLARPKAADALRRFEREARAAGSIESRHVVSVLDTGVDASTNDNYIVMELLSGEDLRQLLRRSGKLPVELVFAIASQVCSGLRRAHEQGIVHRDIKSGNIYLARRDDGHIEVKILDFGIAKLRVDPLASSDGHDLTRSGSVLGSPLYMSPEQAIGSREVDARSDLWSLGVVMYEALTGATPHGNQPLGAVILAICSTPAAPLAERAPWVPAEAAAVVHRALSLDPGQRFASAEQMQKAIDALLPSGAAIHERMFEGIVPETTVEKPSDTPQAASDGSATPPAQTTVDAVTYGSGAKQSRSGSPRRPRLPALLVGGAALVALGAGLVQRRMEAPAPSEAPDASPAAADLVAEIPNHAPVAPAPALSAPATPALPSAEPAASTAPSAPVPAPRGVGKARPVRPLARAAVVAPLPASAAPVPAVPAPPAAVSPPSEPAIDRRFD